MNWYKLHTLGNKHKEFEWTYSSLDCLKIKRVFKNNPLVITQFSDLEIEKILNYIFINKELPLANSVHKLSNGTEIDGIGSFIYNNISRDTTDAQASSQFVALFTKLKILGYNQKPIGMRFWLLNIDWKNKILEYMAKQPPYKNEKSNTL
ncbi:hypothetical protein ACFIJ5_10920 [Haloimpatiens sp. FM7330]|uniref:hypothetical protein n=1 Tax=Haloimpatiens sp. FM7330 TaxID=3298610 RepID=UPI00363A0F46